MSLTGAERIEPRELRDHLLGHGQQVVTLDQVTELLGSPKAEASATLVRLRRAGDMFSPARGLYVAVPPQYRTWGAVPAIDFIDPMLQVGGYRYYVGLLSAAELHGAAHQLDRAGVPGDGGPRRSGPRTRVASGSGSTPANGSPWSRPSYATPARARCRSPRPRSPCWTWPHGPTTPAVSTTWRRSRLSWPRTTRRTSRRSCGRRARLPCFQRSSPRLAVGPSAG